MNKVFAQAAARPAATEERFIAIERFLTDLAVAGFNSQQHRLPVPSSVSNTHDREYSEGARGEARLNPSRIEMMVRIEQE
jgi:hypothetical protein